MSAKRGESGLAGILVVDKPSGMTSHDVVNRVRHALGEKRVGHAGTLDPMATGVLVVLVGPAARLAPYLTAADKTYTARIVFGAATDTDDADGRVTCTAPVPEEVGDPFAAAATVAALVGEHEQVPPAFSAIKVGGRVAHREARAGEAIALEPRTIAVTEARLVGVDVAPQPSWVVELTVSKGTYIRALARDLGVALCTAAHLGELRRTRSGRLTEKDAVPLGKISEAGVGATRFFYDPVLALGLPVVPVEGDAVAHVRNGRKLSRDEVLAAPAAGLVSVCDEGSLLAVYEALDDDLVPQVVFPAGIETGAR